MHADKEFSFESSVYIFSFNCCWVSICIIMYRALSGYYPLKSNRPKKVKSVWQRGGWRRNPLCRNLCCENLFKRLLVPPTLHMKIIIRYMKPFPNFSGHRGQKLMKFVVIMTNGPSLFWETIGQRFCCIEPPRQFWFGGGQVW